MDYPSYRFGIGKAVIAVMNAKYINTDLFMTAVKMGVSDL